MNNKLEICANNWAEHDIDTFALVTRIIEVYKLGFKRGASRCKEAKGFTPDEVEGILIEVGQHDKQFKLGEIIKYSPSDVREILERYESDED